MKYLLPLILLSTSVAHSAAYSQEVEAQERDVNAYHQITFIKYKNGAIQRAKEIVLTFKEADEKAGFEPVVDVWMQTGEWDHMALFTFNEGLDELSYTISPSNARFRNALAEMLGSQEKAVALMDEFNSLVERSERDIGFSHY